MIEETNVLECALILNELMYLDSISVPKKDDAAASLRQLIAQQCQHKMFRVYYDPGLFTPAEIDDILKQAWALFQSNNSTFLFIHERGISFQFIGLWFENTDELDIQKYLFKDQYDDVINKIVSTYDSGKREIENFATYKISRQMIPFFDLVFLIKYQKKIHVSSPDTSILLDTIHLDYPNDQSQL